MKVLVTGGAGFIGSHLCEYLVSQNNTVFSLDNYFSGSFDNHIKGVDYLTGSTAQINEIVDFGVDLVYHLGEYSRVEQSCKDREIVLTSNCHGTYAVAEFCLKNSVKLIYAGSSTKFGDDGRGPDQSPYAWSKATNTQLVKNYGKWFGLSHAVVYFYNVFGGREISFGEYATLIGIFKEKFKSNQPMEVVSPGNQMRNFTHISDIVSGLVLVGEQGHGDGYGIGHDDSHSVMEVAQMFSDSIEMLPSREGNRMSASLVTDKLKDLGWSAKVDLAEHIKEFKKANE